MYSRLRTLAVVLRSASETVLALLVLASVIGLGELRAVYASGAASEGAEGTFVVGFLGLWLFSCLGLLVVGGTHGLVGAVAALRRDGFGDLLGVARRPVAELLVAGAVVVGLGFELFRDGVFPAVLGGSAVVALAVVVHTSVDAVAFVRRVGSRP